MKHVRLGVYILDREYADRFTSCLVKHYRQQMELHIFTEADALWAAERSLDAILTEPGGLEEVPLYGPVICLSDSEMDSVEDIEEKGVHTVEKYQEVNRIVDEILKQIGEEIRDVQAGTRSRDAEMYAVYALSESAYQMPFAVTLASILSERERVLLIDLQENSGLSQMAKEQETGSLEELLVMAQSQKFAPGRIVSCIGHMDRVDYIYPAKNSECLCEARGSDYQNLIQVLARENGYETIILNLGSRFMGFFDTLNDCRCIYLMRGRGGLGQWRRQEFLQEMQRRGGLCLEERLQEIEIPPSVNPGMSCERLIEQWKWNELGDRIRRMIPGVTACG